MAGMCKLEYLREESYAEKELQKSGKRSPQVWYYPKPIQASGESVRGLVKKNNQGIINYQGTIN